MKGIRLIVALIFPSLFGLSQTTTCADIGFENLPVGANTSTAWVSSYQVQPSTLSSPLCANYAGGGFANASSSASVLTTPLKDLMVYDVLNSPFSGNKIMAINKGQYGIRTKITQNFLVDSSHFMYRYAYRAYLDDFHSKCEAGYLCFNFYDCNNSLISALSYTILASSYYSPGANPDSAYWVSGAPFVAGGPVNIGASQTPNWVMHSANLLPYMGSCVTVEVIASGCACGGYEGYCYYDFECSDNTVETPASTIRGTNSFTTCADTATLSGNSAFSSFLWQGPPNSGVSGSTGSVVTTSVSGNYSLSAMSGTANLTTIFNLTVAGSSSVTIVGSNLCVRQGSTITLQAQGAGFNSYSWNNSITSWSTSAAFSIAVTPTVSDQYSVFATTAFGCQNEAVIQIQVQPLANLVHITTSSFTVCPGVPFILSAGIANTSYTWNISGQNANTINSNVVLLTQTGPLPSIYSVTATDPLGCISSDTAMISVYPPLAQITANNDSACFNKSVTLSSQNPAVASYTWNTGQANQSISVAPGTYALSVMGTDGCNSSAGITIVGLPLPLLQLVPSSSSVCAGQSVGVTAISGPSNTYSWNTGSTLPAISENPLTSTLFKVTVTGAFGCTSIDSVAVTVQPLPQIQLSASADQVCEGESVVLSANGTNNVSYTWNNGDAGPSITLMPSATQAYTVSGIDSEGCSNSASKTVEVDICTGIKTSAAQKQSLVVFPNPSNDVFVIKGSKNEKGILLNSLGQLVNQFSLSEENNFSQSFSGFASGIYFVKTANASIKVVVSK